MTDEKRGYSWQPFEPGNTVALRHGALSARVVDAEVAEALPGFLADNPHLDEPSFRFSVERYLRVEVRSRLLHNYAVRVSMEQGVDKVPARVWAEDTNADNAATRLSQQLGVDPASRARIMRDTAETAHAATSAASLQVVVERGRQARESARTVDAPTLAGEATARAEKFPKECPSDPPLLPPSESRARRKGK